ncbi:MAG: adenine phosphoribosyltransferase [Cytophagales bacterium]
MTLEEKIKHAIREVKDFPKQGIYFKDLTPILKNPALCQEITRDLSQKIAIQKPDALAGIESRGFWFGMLIAQELQIPFIPIRKMGKLPYETLSYSYSLEYGTATMEVHTDAFKKGWKVMVHDDLLATGGTATAACELVKMQGATVAGFAFVSDLSFLSGKEKLAKYSTEVFSLATY